MLKRMYSFLMVCTLLAGCASMQNNQSSLYEQLGGQPVIEDITKNLLDIVYADERIAFLFEDTDRAALHETIVDQVCMETGGPCVYEGLDMVEAHSGLEIKYSEFDAFVEDFILAMEASDVPFQLQNQVLAIFAPMRDDVSYQ